MGEAYSTLHAADLLAHLPEGARVWRAYDPSAAWTADRSLAAAMINDLNWLVWSRTKDGRRNRNRPATVGPFKDDRSSKRAARVMTREELDEILSRPREALPEGPTPR